MISHDPQAVGKTSEVVTGIASTGQVQAPTQASVLMSSDFSSLDEKNDVTRTSSMGDLYTLLPSPIQGNADWRKYRCMKLNNGVTVCLVHDKESKTTAAAATVTAGAGSDPRSLPGLARK